MNSKCLGGGTLGWRCGAVMKRESRISPVFSAEDYRPSPPLYCHLWVTTQSRKNHAVISSPQDGTLLHCSGFSLSAFRVIEELL